MACLYPYTLRNPRFDVTQPISLDNAPFMSVPCGHCYFCRLAKVKEIALKIQHERLTRKGKSCFVTLTYNDANLPGIYTDSNTGVKYYDFSKDDLSKLIKRIRRYIDYHKLPYSFKTFCTGEFGHLHGRCHYHFLALGISMEELKPILDLKWKKGFFYIKNCDENASYYCTKYMRKASTSVWWSPDSPKWYYDAILREIKNVYHNSYSIERSFKVSQFVYKGESRPIDTAFVKRVNGVEYHSYTANLTPSPTYSNRCKYCPLLQGFKKAILAIRRVIRSAYENEKRCAFSWSSMSIGSTMALDFMDTWTKKGFINSYSKEGQLIRNPIPRSYKRLYTKTKNEGIDYGMSFLSYSDLFPKKGLSETILSESKTDNFKIFKASDFFCSDYRKLCDSILSSLEVGAPVIGYDASVMLGTWELYNRWKAHRVLPRHLRSDSDSEKRATDFYL